MLRHSQIVYKQEVFTHDLKNYVPNGKHSITSRFVYPGTGKIITESLPSKTTLKQFSRYFDPAESVKGYIQLGHNLYMPNINTDILFTKSIMGFII